MDIPEKLTFKRNEVIRLARLEGRVLDYWQKEFGGFEPMVNPVGEKFYTREDVELILKIKQWMVVERIEKEKIKEKIKQENGHTRERVKADIPAHEEVQVGPSGPGVKQVPREKLRIIRQNLQEILTILDKNGK